MNIFRPRSYNSSGLQKFDQCFTDVKEIEIINYSFDTPTEEVKDDVINPKTGVGTVAVHKANSDAENLNVQYAGSAAVLRCPQTENRKSPVTSDYSNHNGQEKAYESVRQNSARLVCANCQFSGKSLLQIRTEQAAIARAELDTVEIMKARALAMQELAAIDPSFKHL